jgi:G3E family GTPase
MANPGPVCQTFFVDDNVAAHYRLDAIITVVDAKHGMETLDQQSESQQQIGFADRILISKKDLVSEEEFQALRNRIVKINPRASISSVHFGEADINELLDLGGFNLDAILDINPDFLKDEDEHHHHHEHHHEHEHGEHCGTDCGHDHHHAPHQDEIGAFVFRSRKAFDPERLEDFLGGITQVFGPDLLRYKGILYLKGVNRRMLFQGVHMMMGVEPGKPWAAKEKPESKIVFIGRKLPQEIFTQGLENCLV